MALAGDLPSTHTIPMKNKHTWTLTVKTNKGEHTTKYRQGAQAFRNYDCYKPGGWFNYPLSEFIASVLLIRDDDNLMEKKV